ncbi:MAG: GNAT family N-acetyltransferase [Lachnospiraceae bacterium]|nr:GNAT family N-acetyltransferase [Lachnospiraceae bacterium]
MLKCVVFLVTAYYYEVLLTKKEMITAQLLPDKIERVIMNAEDKEQISDKAYDGKYRKEEQLFITDSREVLTQLLEETFYVIPLYHEKNRETFFTGAVYAVEDLEQMDFRSYDAAYRRLAGLPLNILETERLKVRESTVSDVKDFYRIYKDPSITYYMEDLFQDPDEEKAYMESYISQMYGFYGFGMWTVILKETKEVIGRAGLSVREGYDLPELGFVIDVPHQGRGFAYEVCSAILTYAKEELFFEKVQALAEEKNEISIRLLRKLGFQSEGNIVENDQKYKFMIKQL